MLVILKSLQHLLADSAALPEMNQIAITHIIAAIIAAS
jgi:hypothetical protein